MKHKNQHNEITLSQQCYDKLQDDIINGTLQPGQKLKVANLKDQLDMGQSPVREALSRLVTTGLVEAEDNKGFRVAQISEADIRDIYQTYLHIELLAITQAMKLGDDAWEGRIAGALHELAIVETQHKPTSYDVWTERNYNFHVALISGCNSPALMHIRADIYRRFDRYCRISFNLNNSSRKLIANHQEHRELAQAVIARDAKKVEKLLTWHITGSLEDVIAQLKNSSLL